MPIPRMVLLDESRWGGFYVHSTPERYVHRDFDMDLKEGGVIALCGSTTAGTIAHEYRHHWQIQSGYKLSGSIWMQSPGEKYESSIVRFFRTYWWEMDALKFELKHAPDDTSLYWLELLMTDNHEARPVRASSFLEP